ncbi:hypothetical protein C4588_01630 [Candidatus Parcubacteria bacterium]|nr:MAG: hypothetical protein C4588_01630 [Candidatus Parcubacteria bacterium]
MALTDDPSIALQLYYARKRAGMTNAGALWYDWKCEYAYKYLELSVEDPTQRVYLVDNFLYCHECGVEMAMNDYFTMHEDPIPAIYDPNDPNHREALMEMVHERINSMYSYILYLLFMHRPDLATDEQLDCKLCGAPLKLETHEVGWREALID